MVEVEFDEICIFRTTELAWFICFGHLRHEQEGVFLPRSLVEMDEKAKIVSVPEWLFKEKELDRYVG